MLEKNQPTQTGLVEGDTIGQSTGSIDRSRPVKASWSGAQDGVARTLAHEALSNMMWADPGVMSSGIITDLSVLESVIPLYAPMLEETNLGDHDNDGVDDLNDLDDDNDGIYDLLERFDGCYGTDPYDHDNDGILRH